MKKWLVLLLLFFAYKLRAQIIVSGFDDNIRQSENVSVLASFQRFFLKDDEPYTGMALLYSLMQKESQDKKIYILTGMPSLFRSRAESFMQSVAFPEHQLILRNLFTDWPTVSFKLKHIEEWMQKHQQMILIKDNSDVSLDLGKAVKQKYGARLLRYYARETSKRALPAGVTGYITPVDIAYGEMLDKRLSAESLEMVLDQLLQEKNFDLIIPAWSYCPLDYNPCPLHSYPKCTQFAQIVQTQCRQRKEKS